MCTKFKNSFEDFQGFCIYIKSSVNALCHCKIEYFHEL